MDTLSALLVLFAGIHPLLVATQITNFMGPTGGPPVSCRPQMGPMLAPWTTGNRWIPSTKQSFDIYFVLRFWTHSRVAGEIKCHNAHPIFILSWINWWLYLRHATVTFYWPVQLLQNGTFQNDWYVIWLGKRSLLEYLRTKTIGDCVTGILSKFLLTNSIPARVLLIALQLTH